MEQSLIEFAKETIATMETLKGEEYAKYWVNRIILEFRRYGRIIVSSQGLDHFPNIVKYWDDPDSYLKKDRFIDKEAIRKGQDYELNFVLLIKKNKK